MLEPTHEKVKQPYARRPNHQRHTSDEVGMKRAGVPASFCRPDHQRPTSDEVGMRENVTAPRATLRGCN